LKKIAAFLIIAMVLSMSTAVLINVFKAESLPSGEDFIDRVENSLSENIPFREKLSGLMDTIRYSSGVRHFDDIYIGNDGSLLLDIEKPTSRTFSAAALRIASSFAARDISSTAKICIQSKAALAAPLIATVATGMPVGIITVARSASIPSS
jgi:hypothetical protein